MSLRSDLARARGLGAAHDGVQHWWRQRISALALVPLALWFAFSVAHEPLADYAGFVAWLEHPAVAIALILFVALVFYHSALGLQVVIEDYVASTAWRLGLMLAQKGLHAVLAVAAIFAVLRVALAGVA